MSIPYEVVHARGQYRAGKLTPKQFLAVLKLHNYPRPRIPQQLPPYSRPGFDGEAGTYSDGRCYCCKPDPAWKR